MVTFKMFRRDTPTNNDFRSPDEKALVRRLDIFLMTFGCLSQGTLWLQISPEERKTDIFKLLNISISKISIMHMFRA
jgi:hypothetical protein